MTPTMPTVEQMPLRGVCLGIDVGKARVGVARCDVHRMLATPLETIHRDPDAHTDIGRICEIVREIDAVEVIVGLPYNLRGEATASTQDAREFARLIAGACGSTLDQKPLVRLVDERLSTVSAQAQLHAVGKNTKQSRTMIDQAAAVVILQHALDSDAQQGKRTGSLVFVRPNLHESEVSNI